MRRSVVAPDGTVWTVRRIETPWRLRRRGGFSPDLAGILLWILAWPLLLLEAIVWLLGAGIVRLRRAAGTPWIIEAVSTGPPERRLRWSVRGGPASLAEIETVSEGLTQGRDVASTAERRDVGVGVDVHRIR